MADEKWQKVREIFNSALRQKPDERRKFISDACGDDEALLAEVRSLLSSHDSAESFMETPAVAKLADVIETEGEKLEAGNCFGHYEIIKQIGAGGMGEVYLAKDTRLERQAAIKVLPGNVVQDEERMPRFVQEAKSASALNHPNIITIYEIGETENTHFIATEYIEGDTIRERLQSSRLSLKSSLEIAIQVASALDAAHRTGIVHRDIKPENVMVRPDGVVKILDFGIAKLTEKLNETDLDAPTIKAQTRPGTIIGTAGYMSPEQARGQAVDARSDIFSVGVMLYEMLAGKRPFAGENAMDIIGSILNKEPLPLGRQAPEIPHELERIVNKALRKDREERYQTAKDLLIDLKDVKQDLEFQKKLDRTAPPDSDEAKTQGSNATTSDSTPLTTSSAEYFFNSLKHHKRVAVLGLVLLILVGGFLLTYKFWPRKESVAHFQSMGITRITNSGKAVQTTLSPDGRYIVYSLSDVGKQSLWIRQVSTANDKLIVPPAPLGFFGVTFSPDGNDVYYATKTMDRGTLYRLPALGGTPVKLMESLDGPVSISPDGKQLVLVRANYPNPGESALVIANTDGTSERNLAIRKAPEHFAPIFFTGPSWSPDGKLVAASVGRTGSPSHVFAFAVADGKATDLTPHPWPLTSRVAWLPDMSGLLVTAGETFGVTQIWFLSYPGGERRRITNDLNSYRSISLAADGTKFSTIQTTGLVNIWIAADGDANRALQLPTGNVGFFGSSGTTLSWTPNDDIVFVSNETGNLDIWFMDSKGENRRQLTTNAGQNFSPVVSPDGRYIVFTSNRAGNQNIWRIGIDGSEPKPLTSGVDDGLANISPDGRWVFYSSLVSGKRTLWRVGIDGGTPAELTNRPATSPIVSPDGKFITYLYPDSSDALAPPNRMAIMPIEGGEPIKTFAFPSPTIIATAASWSRDGRSILYTVNNNNVTNIWSQPIEGGPPRQVSDFKDSLMTGFAWSRDGKVLACTRGVLLRDVVLISDTR